MKTTILNSFIASALLSPTAAFYSVPALNYQSSTTSMLQMSSADNDNSRRNFLVKSSLPFAALVLGGREASASLLDDFGGSDFKNFEVKKVEEAPVANKGMAKGEGGIDP